MSPCCAILVFVYSASPPLPRSTYAGPPPAMPHGWYTGADPGLRQGLCLVTSAAEPAAARTFTVRSAGSLIVAFVPLPHRSRAFGFEGPPSGRPQPMVAPCENHMQACPGRQGLLPLTQSQPQVSPRVISDCHFRKPATEYDRKTGIKWLSCTEK